MTSALIAPLAIEIHPGEHPEGHFLGMTFNLDTIWVTVVAGAIVVALGFWAKAKLTDTFKAIKAAPSSYGAASIAIQTFGKRAGPQLAGPLITAAGVASAVAAVAVIRTLARRA